MNLFQKCLKGIVEFSCALGYAVFLLLIRNKPRRVVLCYHSVKKRDVKSFRRQIEYLARVCTVVKPSNIRIAQANGTDYVTAITFDDAFVNVIRNAVPILKEYGLTAGIFVPTDNIGQPPRWELPENCLDKNETIMSKEHIAELDKDGFEVFSHTISHSMLTEIDEDRLKCELLESKRELERITGRKVSAISYPHGEYDTRVCKAAKRTGYKFGFTIEPRMIDCSPDDMRIGRFVVSPRDNLLKFRLKVSGAYQAVKYLRALKKLFVRKPMVGQI